MRRFSNIVSYENGKNEYGVADVRGKAVRYIKYYSEEMVRNNGFTNKMKVHKEMKEAKCDEALWCLGHVNRFNFSSSDLDEG